MGRRSVGAVSLVLFGCAAHPVAVEVDPLPTGHILSRPGRPGVLVAAPHGTSDPMTAEVAVDVADRTGFGLVVATGFSIEFDSRGQPLRRYQVNRPREGVPGQGASHERATPIARRVHEEYERRVREAAQAPLDLYVEIHGNSRRHTAHHIEIATVGLDRAQAIALRTLLARTRDAHLASATEAPRLRILVEPADPLFYGAGGAKREGSLRWPERALHIELPRAARRDARDVYTAVLAEFLAQAVSCWPPPAPTD